MKISSDINRIYNEIIKLINPQKIILYGRKMNIPHDKVKEISLCVIIEAGDKKNIEKKIYLNIESELPYNVIIYTAEEWDMLSVDTTSYAHAITEKGVVLYDKKSTEQQ